MVIMYTREYDQKMEALLDNPTYKTTNKDPTAAFQRKNNSIVNRLLYLKLINKSTATHLRTYTAICPRIYGQPKAHKENLPLRPVVPNITAPTYALSKFVANILQQAFKSDYNVSDSFEFTQYINTITLPPDYVLVSFDVVSLFTNVPQELIIRTIIFRWSSIKEKTNINLDLFLEIIEFCLQSSYFQFRGKFYVQMSGTAMGSPLSPILADMVMEDLLANVTQKLSFTPPVLKKYVDDLILALPKQATQETLRTFNEFHTSLQFTMEEENNGSLPYLDTKIIRTANQTLCTEWYSKPISSGRILNYHSFHPLSMKINVASNFIHRVINLTTNSSIAQQKQIIFQHLRRNNYPSALINRLTNTLTQHSITRSTNPSTDSCPEENNVPEITYRSMINIPSLSSTLISILKKDYPSVQIALKTTKTTRNLLRPVKDPIEPLQQYNVIYSIPCNDCDRSYIGMTKNQLKTRISGHKSNVNKYASSQDIPDDNSHKTALIQHMLDFKHSFNLSNTKIIDRTYKSSDLPILEMCHIQNTSNTVNYRTDVDNLNTTYAGILHTYKNTLSRRNQSLTSQNNTDRHTHSSIETIATPLQ